MPDQRYNFAAWWHLLSLDAPTVSILWALLFVRAMHLPFHAAAVLLLGTATWLVYVADRILDGVGRQQKESLQERHFFHARHRRAFLSVGLFLLPLSAWMLLTKTYSRTLYDGSFLALLAVLYLLSVHAVRGVSAQQRSRWLPKEIAVGILFAIGTALPAWSRLSASPELPRLHLFEAVAFFAALCWINCVAIEKWETGAATASQASRALKTHASTRWAVNHLQLILAMIAAFSAIAACLAPAPGLRAVYLASLLSSTLILALDARRSRIAPLYLRIAADAALLTPLAFFPILR